MADKLGFIGGGNMSSAIIAGLIDSGVDPASIAIAEPVLQQQQLLAERFPETQVTPSNGIVAASAGVLVLGVGVLEVVDAVGSWWETQENPKP